MQCRPLRKRWRYTGAYAYAPVLYPTVRRTVASIRETRCDEKDEKDITGRLVIATLGGPESRQGDARWRSLAHANGWGGEAGVESDRTLA